MLQSNKKAGQLSQKNYQLKSKRSFQIGCLEHRKANSYGMPLNFKDKCECCSRYSAKQPLTANFSPLKIYYTGSQLPSFLSILKILGILFAVLSLGFAVPLTIINYNGRACRSIVNCTGSFFLRISAFNSFDEAWRLYSISYASIFLFILFTVSLLLIRKSTKSIKNQIDQVDLFPSPYSVYVNLPQGYGNEHTIWNEVEKWWKRQLKSSKNQMKILFPELYNKSQMQQECKQTRIYKEQEFKSSFKVKKRHSKSKILENILFFDKEKRIKPIEESKAVQMDSFHRRKTEILPHQETKQFTESKFCLLIFKKKQYSEYFIKKTSPSVLQKILLFSKFRQLCLNKKEVKVQQDMYPSEIFWQNQPCSKSEHIKSQLLSYLFIFLCFIFNSAIFSGISYLLNSCVSDQDGDIDKDNIPFLSKYFYVLSSFCINGITYLFNKLIYYYSKNEKHYTYSHKQTSLIVKTLFNNLSAMFLMPFMTIKLMGNKFLWVESGFLQTSNCTLLIYMVCYLFQKYVSVCSLSAIYNYYKMDETQSYSQKQANLRYEKPKMKIEEKYSTMLTVIFLTLINIPFSPYLLILGTVWFFIQFWLQKISIAYFYSEDEYHGSTLTQSVIKITELFFIPILFSIFSVFCVCLEFSLIEDITVVIVISIVLAVLGILLACSPSEKISERLFSCKKSLTELSDAIKAQASYRNVAQKFLFHYEKYERASIWQLKFRSEQRCRESNNMSENVKFQMKEIEKSLTQSLKQQLINHKMAILQKKQKKETGEDHQQYYEYQRKVQMRKTQPKIPIPSLLQKAPLLFNHSETIKQKHYQDSDNLKIRKSTLPKAKASLISKGR